LSDLTTFMVQIQSRMRAGFDHFPKYHMKILLGDFNTKVGRENISNRHLGMRFYIGILMIMVLEYKLCKSKV